MADERVSDSVAQAAQRLQRAWQSGGNTDLSQYLPAAGGLQRTEMLVQLIKVDQQHRWRSGVHIRLEQYLEQWPELQGNVNAIRELLDSESSLRAALGDKPTQAELQRRFPTLFESAELNTTPVDADRGDAKNSGRPGPRPRSSFDTTPVSLDSNPTPHSSWRLSPSGGKVGRYEIRALLGAGGMGEVYRAYDTELQREVALKIPRVDPGAKPEMLARFVQEALAAASLRHPHICPIYDAGQMEDRYYIVMALIEGNNLADTLKKGAVDPALAVRIASQLARALDTAHEAGIVHRDIKPANVLMDRGEQPLLTDFGLARRIDNEEQLSAAGSFLGTPAFMSPEQAEMKPVDRRTDVYSLGVVLYQMLTGQLPFPGPPAQLLLQIVKGKPPRPRKLKPDLDAALESICLKAMARDAEHRYQTAAQFADALEAYANPPAPAPVNVRKRVLWSAIVGILLVAVGFTLVPWGILTGRSPGGGEVVRKPPPLTPRQQRIAVLQQQLAKLAPVTDEITAVREMENKYIDVKGSVFGVNAHSFSRDVTAAMTELKSYGPSTKEAVVFDELERFLAQDSIFKTPEDSYLLLREVAELMDVRIANLQAQLAAVQSESDTTTLPAVDTTDTPPEQANTAAERDWRLRETRRQLDGLRGADAEVAGMRGIEDRWRQTQGEMFGMREGAAVAVASHVFLARLYALELTEQELALYRVAEDTAARLNAFSRLEDIYTPARLLAESVNGRLAVLRGKLKGLSTWTPESKRYEELVEMRPRPLQVDCDHARVLAAAGKRDEAIEVLSQAIERAADDAVLYALRATIHGDDQQFDAAWRDVEQVLSLNSQLAYGYYLRGHLHAVKQEYILAVADCDHATRFDPLLVQAYRTRATAYNHVKAFDRAIEDCNEAIRIAPHYADAYRIRALASIGLENWDQALEDILETIRLDPLIADGHYIHARILHHNEQYEQALQTLTKAVHLDSQVSAYYLLRADCYEKLGNTLRATGDRVRAQRMDEDAQKQAAPPAPPQESESRP